MKIISNCTSDLIKQAAKSLKEGHLVAFPTETVYGLGVDATNEKAVSRIYSVKGRPSDHPLIVHISSINGLADWASQVPEYAIALARAFWPGPMSLILPRTKLAQDFITGGQENVGLRVPSHPLALELLRQFENEGGKGIAAPSANRFGAVSPTTADAVYQELGAYLTGSDLILDGDQSTVGIESTIIDCTETIPQILRPGAVTTKMVEELINIQLVQSTDDKSVRVSGHFKSHYAPKAKVALGENAKPGDGLIALSSVPTPPGVTRLTSPSDTKEFARNLYQALRNADHLGIGRVSIIVPSGEGLEEAIKDRVEKAASGLRH
jgi:L-threonylcarbamoyladenylate synthase